MTSHRQRLKWLSSSPSTRSGYTDVSACSFMARTPLETACGRRAAPSFKGLPRATYAAARSASVDRGEAETSPFARAPEVPRTDLLLRRILLLYAAPLRKLTLRRGGADVLMSRAKTRTACPLAGGVQPRAQPAIPAHALPSEGGSTRCLSRRARSAKRSPSPSSTCRRSPVHRDTGVGTCMQGGSAAWRWRLRGVSQAEAATAISDAQVGRRRCPAEGSLAGRLPPGASAPVKARSVSLRDRLAAHGRSLARGGVPALLELVADADDGVDGR